MLISILLSLALSSAPAAHAEGSSPVLVSVDVRGFGGPVVGLAQAGDGVAMVVGGRGGLLIDGRWMLGASLSGTPLFLGAGAAPVDTERLAFWHGGVLVSRHFGERWPVQPRVGLVLGAAWVRVDSATSRREGLAFAAEPSLGAELHLTRFLRVGLDVGYRLIVPAPSGLRLEQVSGVTGALTMHFGWF